MCYSATGSSCTGPGIPPMYLDEMLKGSCLMVCRVTCLSIACVIRCCLTCSNAHVLDSPACDAHAHLQACACPPPPPLQGYYFTGDGCRRDEDGYIWITGVREGDKCDSKREVCVACQPLSSCQIVKVYNLQDRHVCALSPFVGHIIRNQSYSLDMHPIHVLLHRPCGRRDQRERAPHQHRRGGVGAHRARELRRGSGHRVGAVCHRYIYMCTSQVNYSRNFSRAWVIGWVCIQYQHVHSWHKYVDNYPASAVLCNP
jgi:hypothetical protein